MFEFPLSLIAMFEFMYMRRASVEVTNSVNTEFHIIASLVLNTVCTSLFRFTIKRYTTLNTVCTCKGVCVCADFLIIQFLGTLNYFQ
jgi:hypothetical protein